MSKKIITRFPPSPTGSLHIGNVRTALFNYLFAKHGKGNFIVRIEDTDKIRSKIEYEKSMLDSLEWLGLRKDGELWRQSERTDVYKKYLIKLISDNKAYFSEEVIISDPKAVVVRQGESIGSRKSVIRFNNPNKDVIFNDLIRGEIKFNTEELGNFVIAKSLDEPLYHLTVVVDDFEAGITHVIRGEDHISNTSRQILIQEAIGAPRPIYAHLPLILATDRSKLSKRKHGDRVSLDYYRQKGYLPEAIINYLALLGWNLGTEQEIFTLEELIKVFDISQIHKGGAIFDEKKLEWINKQHIKLLSLEEKQKIIAREFDVKKILELDREKICWKEISKEETLKHLAKAKEIISEGGASADSGASLMTYATEVGKGNVLWPVRYALSGLEKSPDPFTLLTILGKNESIKRLENAIESLS
ncbi:MAG: glutamate--tRNA ligase family protein [bacterium]|nr:glutamate--tRNA ligase family protein [bacterium]